MDDAPVDLALPPGLKWLKGLVIVLTLTLIGGVITVVGLLVTRLPQMATPGPGLPDTLVLPQGTRAAAVTAGDGWFVVVTTDDRLLIFGRDGTFRQEIDVEGGLGD